MTPIPAAVDTVVHLGRRSATVRRRSPVHASGLPALVLVHGAGGNHRSFDELLSALGPDLDVIVPALPGRLASDGPACRSVHEAAQFVDELVRALGLAHFIVAGHSYGGAIALDVAITACERAGTSTLRGLALMATGARLRVHPAILKAMERAAETGQLADTALSAFRSDTAPALVRSVGERLALTSPSAASADWQAANAFDCMTELARIDLPTLVLGGAEDALTPPKYAEYLAAHIRGAELVLLDRAGHMFPNERAREAAQLLERFVRARRTA